MPQYITQEVSTVASLTTAATDVTDLSASDTAMWVESFTVLNTSTTIALLYRIGSKEWITVQPTADGNGFARAISSGIRGFKLGGDQNVEWKSASSTIVNPQFIYNQIHI